MDQSTIKIRTDTLARFDAAQAKLIGETGKPISRSEYLDRVSRKTDHIHDELVKEQKNQRGD